MCGGGGSSKPAEPAPPPPAPVQTASLEVGDNSDEDTLKKKRSKGVSKLKIPIKKTTAPTTGLNVPKVT